MRIYSPGENEYFAAHSNPFDIFFQPLSSSSVEGVCVVGVSQCGAPGSPVGGSVDLPGLTGDSLYSPGTVARYQCDEGRVRSGGQEARRCQQDGTWAGHPPTCSKGGVQKFLLNRLVE